MLANILPIAIFGADVKEMKLTVSSESGMPGDNVEEKLVLKTIPGSHH